MTAIRLSALIGSHPLGALAAFGLLRLTNAAWDDQAKLRFEMEDDWIAVLETSAFGSADLLIARLSEWVTSSDPDRVLGWADDVRVSVDDYRRHLANALRGDDRYLADFLTTIATDGAVDKQKQLVKPSAFYMVSGQQSFNEGMKQIFALVRAQPVKLFQEALLGPWSYKSRTHSLGWDPNAERLYALRHRAPTAEKPSCVAGAMLLAFAALPFMPVVSKAGRALTVGFSRVRGNQKFCWPVFSSGIDSFELQSLLRAGRRHWISGDSRSLKRGIEAVFESERFEFGQGYAVLRAARRLLPENPS
jgi:hypothetical protein